MLSKPIHNPQSSIRNPSGFSLLEVIVVLLIVSIAGAVVMPSMRTGLSGMRLEAKGRDLATLCRSARILAVGQQSVYRVAVERDKNRIFLADAYHEKVRDFELTDEIQIDAVKYEGNDDHEQVLFINFYPNGRADEAEVWLKNNRGRKVLIKTELLTGTARLIVPREQR
ncbi:MAG TPA: prepilin-type N-terminal cleavage/methylation domain-containing protein [Acidobacteriota bacterium]|jgi:general secretion pathway protein H